MNIKNFFRLLIIGIISLGIIVSLGFSQKASAATNERMMDDAIFDDSQSMQAGDIQNFLNVFPNSCLKNYTDEFPYDYFNYSGSASSAWVIRRVADLWGVSPKLLLAKLEQESNLVTGSGGCAQWRYISAMGYNCPDHLSQNPRTTTYRGQTVQTCVGQDADMGFSRQVTKGAWLLKFAKERSVDNINWQGNSDIIYYGKFVNAGLHKRCGNCAAVYDDGVFQGVDIQTAATASFYNYTPYINQGLDEIYEGWFGSTITGRCITDANLPLVSEVVFSKTVRNLDLANLSVYSGTSTNCMESHVWNPNMGTWNSHRASNQPIGSYPDLQIIYGDLDGSGIDYPILFGVRNTSTNKVESHVWNKEMNKWLAHAASNQATIDPSDCKIILADLDGNKRDDPTLICLQNTSTGKIELHTWSNGMQSWRDHIITNMPVVNPTQNTIISGDIDGNGVDELILVAYNQTGSSKVEFHVWNPGQWSWRSHISTNLPEVDPAQSKVEFADLNADGTDEAVLVSYKNTGSGRIEFHVWNPGYYSWLHNIASNQPIL